MNIFKKQRGVTLIEAMIAMAVMVTGTAAVLGIHSYVSGTSAQSRIETAAMGLAQEKIEELRGSHFDSIEDGFDTRTITIPMLGSTNSMTLTRCWNSIDTLADTGIPVARMKQINVNIIRENDTCESEPIASLNSFISKQDPREAALNIDDQKIADGDGIKTVDKDDIDISSPDFNFDINEDGTVTSITNPQTGETLKKSDGSPLKYATISGNIFYYNLGTFPADINSVLDRVRVRAQGAATCKVFFPGFDDDDVPGSFTSADEKTIHHIQYSCVVADGWRRSIFLSVQDNEDVCVGYPNETASAAEGDIYKFRGRSYVGFENVNELVGVRGSEIKDGSLFGSVCTNGDCLAEPELRGLIPGGHHFFIKPKNENVRCVDAMTAAFSEIDPDTSEETFSLNGLILRNPSAAFCVSDPNFTDSLSTPTFDEETGVSISNTNFCYSFTRASGFITSESSVAEALELITTPSVICPTFSLPGEDGPIGGYLCDFVDFDINDYRYIKAIPSPNPDGDTLAIFSNGGSPILNADGTDSAVITLDTARFKPLGASEAGVFLSDRTNLNINIVDDSD